MEHLTPMQFAMLLDGQANGEFERQAGIHFRECHDCWDEWLLGLSAQAAEAREQAQDGTLVLETSPSLLSIRSPRIFALPLFPFVDEFDERAAAASAPAFLPSLATEDHSIVVQFREVVAGGLIRASLVARKVSIPGTIGLNFPDAGLSFEFNRHGKTELPGVSADQLRTARLELRLEEISDDPAPSSDA